MSRRFRDDPSLRCSRRLQASRLPLPAQADAVADFYKGKQISVIIGTSAGNDYDFRARLLARHMGRFIPGEPTLVPRNMPGAGGINAANYLANVAPHDGTTIHLIMANMMDKQAVGVPGIKFDARKFSWIGNTTSTPERDQLLAHLGRHQDRAGEGAAS